MLLEVDELVDVVEVEKLVDEDVEVVEMEVEDETDVEVVRLVLDEEDVDCETVVELLVDVVLIDDDVLIVLDVLEDVD